MVIRPCCGVMTLPMSPSWNRIAATRHSCRMSPSADLQLTSDLQAAVQARSLCCCWWCRAMCSARYWPGSNPSCARIPGSPGRPGAGEPDSGRLLQEVAREVLGMPFHWRSSRARPSPAGAGRRSADRHLGGLDPRRLCRRSLPPAALRPLVPGLYQSGLHRSATGRAVKNVIAIGAGLSLTDSGLAPTPEPRSSLGAWWRCSVWAPPSGPT